MYEPGEDGHGCGRRHGPGQVIPAPETEPNTTQQGATYEHQEQQSPRQAQLREHPHGITVRLLHLDGRISMLVEVVFVVLGSQAQDRLLPEGVRGYLPQIQAHLQAHAGESGPCTRRSSRAVSYTHLRAHETKANL